MHTEWLVLQRDLTKNLKTLRHTLGFSNVPVPSRHPQYVQCVDKISKKRCKTFLSNQLNKINFNLCKRFLVKLTTCTHQDPQPAWTQNSSNHMCTIFYL